MAASAAMTLVIGATGNIGGEIVSQMAAKGTPVRAMTRNPEVARFTAQVEVVRGDLTNPDTVAACLKGIEAVFLVWTAGPSAVHRASHTITKRARRVVFLSAPLKTPHPFFQQPNPQRDVAQLIEQTIENSGCAWTFLRPGMFAANARHFWGPHIRNGCVVRWPYLSAPTAPIDEKDVASIAVRALLGEGHAGNEYVLTGPQSLTQEEQIRTIGNVIGRSLRIEDIPPDEARHEWVRSMLTSVANMLLDAWAAAIGQPAFVTSTVEEITGRPARTFADWVRDHAREFRASRRDQSAPPAGSTQGFLRNV